ncbi:MAG: hypothetical protein A2X59_08580 [Nitrospirae bacterium GWC2_42_7]|nr:MAG: hypothetical protein A2X59_08580 [Nitrospirae bacterium GWC2_42_7]
MMKILKYILLAMFIFGLSSCGGPTPVKTTERFDAEKSFEKANKMIDDKKYEEARTLLFEIKNRDFSRKFAPLAQLRIADSYVNEGETELAAAEFRRFLESYPDHRNAVYAQYQTAMIYFNEIESPERGYSGAARALAEFERLKQNYPRNPYKDLIEIRIEKCRSIMAEYEFIVGDFYLKNGSYNAAIMRFETLLQKFPDYNNEAKVLLSLGIAYKKDGKEEKAEELFERLIEKYPNVPFAADAKKELALSNKAKKEQALVPTVKKGPFPVITIKKKSEQVKPTKEEPMQVKTAKKETLEAEPAERKSSFVAEGSRIKIKNLMIIGNKNISKRKIKKAMGTSKRGFFSFITSSGYYKKDQMEKDISKIKDLYFDHGFIRVVIDGPEIIVNENKNTMTIVIRITEGDQYKVSSIDFNGNKALNSEILMKKVSVVPGAIFNKTKIEKNISSISKVYSKNGYNLPSIKQDIVPDDQNRTVQVLFNIEEGDKPQPVKK